MTIPYAEVDTSKQFFFSLTKKWTSLAKQLELFIQIFLGFPQILFYVIRLLLLSGPGIQEKMPLNLSDLYLYLIFISLYQICSFDGHTTWFKFW